MKRRRAVGRQAAGEGGNRSGASRLVGTSDSVTKVRRVVSFSLFTSSLGLTSQKTHVGRPERSSRLDRDLAVVSSCSFFEYRGYPGISGIRVYRVSGYIGYPGISGIRVSGYIGYPGISGISGIRVYRVSGYIGYIGYIGYRGYLGNAGIAGIWVTRVSKGRGRLDHFRGKW
jgi:hypothetical protein